MPKERVIVFDGEDKFVAPRNMVYDKTSGEAAVVGEPDNLVSSGEKKIFDDYMERRMKVAVLPVVGEPDFCANMKKFIESRGDGLASPEQIMEAYQLFQDNCVEKPKETPIVPPVDAPPPSGEPQPIPQPDPEPKPIASAPTEPTPAPAPVSLPSGVSLSVPNLGVRPSGGAQGGGGGEEKKDEPKKGSNWLIWLLIGGAALYFITRKKD